MRYIFPKPRLAIKIWWMVWGVALAALGAAYAIGALGVLR
jgi:hypothetical protein